MIRLATGRRDRGFTLLESFVALAVLATGMLGLLALTSVGVRANHFGRRMAQAEELAHDLAEQVAHWDYTDVRLNPLCGSPAVIASCVLDQNTITQPAFTGSWNIGTLDAISNNGTPYQVQYGERPNSGPQPDANAVTPSALGLGKTPYSGTLSDPNPDVSGAVLFSRYWNVYTFNPVTGVNGGKLVQIFVRWKEPGLGWRVVAISTYKSAPYLFVGP
jgi:prepilin-type N-terminal cleavage/methylation domain-containing protein